MPARSRVSAATGLSLSALSVWWIACFAVYISPAPIDYTHVHLTSVTILSIAAFVLAATGYGLGARVGAAEPDLPASARLPASALPFIGLLAMIVLFYPSARAYSAFSIGDINGALANQQEAYAATTEAITTGEGSRGALLAAQAIFAPVTLSVVPYFGLRFFLTRKGAVPLAIASSLAIVTSILTARDQQIGQIVLTVFASWILALAIGERRLRGIHLTAVAGTVLGVFLLSATRKIARSGVSVLHCAPGAARCEPREANLSNVTAHYTASYMSQGFEGLGRALSGTWNWGGGVSHSPAINRLFPGFWPSPAPTVTDQLVYHGWSDHYYWSTALTPMANDLPWVLVPIACFGFGFLGGHSWSIARATGHWIDVTVFCLTWFGLFFLPQNLQLAVSGPTYVGYVTLVIVYTFRRLRRYGRAGTRTPYNRSVRPFRTRTMAIGGLGSRTRG